MVTAVGFKPYMAEPGDLPPTTLQEGPLGALIYIYEIVPLDK